MTEIERLQAKREALQASLEHIIGQANRVNGAIAVIDELLVEARKAVEAEEMRKFEDMRERCESSRYFLDLEAQSFGDVKVEPIAPREMLPVTVEAEQESDQ